MARILVYCGHPDRQQRLRSWLANHELIFTADVRTACGKVERFTPDLVLVEWDEVGGPDLLRALRLLPSNRPSQVVLFEEIDLDTIKDLTLLDAFTRQAFKDGANGFIPLPKEASGRDSFLLEFDGICARLRIGVDGVVVYTRP